MTVVQKPSPWPLDLGFQLNPHNVSTPSTSPYAAGMALIRHMEGYGDRSKLELDIQNFDDIIQENLGNELVEMGLVGTALEEEIAGIELNQDQPLGEVLTQQVAILQQANENFTEKMCMPRKRGTNSNGASGGIRGQRSPSPFRNTSVGAPYRGTVASPPVQPLNKKVKKSFSGESRVNGFLVRRYMKKHILRLIESIEGKNRRHIQEQRMQIDREKEEIMNAKKGVYQAKNSAEDEIRREKIKVSEILQAEYCEDNNERVRSLKKELNHHINAKIYEREACVNRFSYLSHRAYRKALWYRCFVTWRYEVSSTRSQEINRCLYRTAHVLDSHLVIIAIQFYERRRYHLIFNALRSNAREEISFRHTTEFTTLIDRYTIITNDHQKLLGKIHRLDKSQILLGGLIYSKQENIIIREILNTWYRIISKEKQERLISDARKRLSDFGNGLLQRVIQKCHISELHVVFLAWCHILQYEKQEVKMSKMKVELTVKNGENASLNRARAVLGEGLAVKNAGKNIQVFFLAWKSIFTTDSNDRKMASCGKRYVKCIKKISMAREESLRQNMITRCFRTWSMMARTHRLAINLLRRGHEKRILRSTFTSFSVYALTAAATRQAIETRELMCERVLNGYVTLIRRKKFRQIIYAWSVYSKASKQMRLMGRQLCKSFNVLGIGEVFDYWKKLLWISKEDKIQKKRAKLSAMLMSDQARFEQHSLLCRGFYPWLLQHRESLDARRSAELDAAQTRIFTMEERCEERRQQIFRQIQSLRTQYMYDGFIKWKQFIIKTRMDQTISDQNKEYVAFKAKHMQKQLDSVKRFFMRPKEGIMRDYFMSWHLFIKTNKNKKKLLHNFDFISAQMSTQKVFIAWRNSTQNFAYTLQLEALQATVKKNEKIYQFDITWLRFVFHLLHNEEFKQSINDCLERKRAIEYEYHELRHDIQKQDALDEQMLKVETSNFLLERMVSAWRSLVSLGHKEKFRTLHLVIEEEQKQKKSYRESIKRHLIIFNGREADYHLLRIIFLQWSIDTILYRSDKRVQRTEIIAREKLKNYHLNVIDTATHLVDRLREMNATDTLFIFLRIWRLSFINDRRWREIIEEDSIRRSSYEDQMNRIESHSRELRKRQVYNFVKITYTQLEYESANLIEKVFKSWKGIRYFIKQRILFIQRMELRILAIIFLRWECITKIQVLNREHCQQIEETNNKIMDYAIHNKMDRRESQCSIAEVENLKLISNCLLAWKHLVILHQVQDKSQLQSYQRRQVKIDCLIEIQNLRFVTVPFQEWKYHTERVREEFYLEKRLAYQRRIRSELLSNIFDRANHHVDNVKLELSFYAWKSVVRINSWENRAQSELVTRIRHCDQQLRVKLQVAYASIATRNRELITESFRLWREITLGIALDIARTNLRELEELYRTSSFHKMNEDSQEETTAESRLHSRSASPTETSRRWATSTKRRDNRQRSIERREIRAQQEQLLNDNNRNNGLLQNNNDSHNLSLGHHPVEGRLWSHDTTFSGSVDSSTINPSELITPGLDRHRERNNELNTILQSNERHHSYDRIRPAFQRPQISIETHDLPPRSRNVSYSPIPHFPQEDLQITPRDRMYHSEYRKHQRTYTPPAWRKSSHSPPSFHRSTRDNHRSDHRGTASRSPPVGHRTPSRDTRSRDVVPHVSPAPPIRHRTPTREVRIASPPTIESRITSSHPLTASSNSIGRSFHFTMTSPIGSPTAKRPEPSSSALRLTTGLSVSPRYESFNLGKSINSNITLSQRSIGPTTKSNLVNTRYPTSGGATNSSDYVVNRYLTNGGATSSSAHPVSPTLSPPPPFTALSRSTGSHNITASTASRHRERAVEENMNTRVAQYRRDFDVSKRLKAMDVEWKNVKEQSVQAHDALDRNRLKNIYNKKENSKSPSRTFGSKDTNRLLSPTKREYRISPRLHTNSLFSQKNHRTNDIQNNQIDHLNGTSSVASRLSTSIVLEQMKGRSVSMTRAG